MALAATAVVLIRPGTFTPVVFVPGDEVPDWAVELITNPEVLVSVPTEPAQTPARRPRKPNN